MRTLELENFFLLEFDFQNETHHNVLNKIESTKEGKHFLGNINYAITKINQRKEKTPYNIAYIVYYLDDPMGYISLTYFDNAYQISYGITPEYRGQYLGSLLLMEFSDKLFELFPEIEKLTLKINDLNIGSIKLAEKVGYEKQDKETYTQRRM